MKIRLPKRPAAYDPDKHPNSGSRKVRLFDPLAGKVVYLPWMPDEIETSNMAQQWTQINRPGRRPLLLSQGKGLPTVSLPIKLVAPGHGVDQQPTIDALDKLARGSNPVRLDVGGQYRGLYRITGLTVRETHWDVAGRVREADVTVELTQSSDMAAMVGPIRRKTKISKAGGVKGRLKNGARRV
jgi:phage protein U